MYSPRLTKSYFSEEKQQRSLTSRTPTSYRKPFTPSRTSSRNQSLNCSFQTSYVIEETSEHVVEVYGATLPVLVTEALTLAERGTEVSVKLCDYGWACLVCGRRLFLWKFKQTTEVRNMVSHCRELTLPPSDLAHKAELVCILVSRDAHMPAALAVSPEGIVRYWPNIAHEGSSVEIAAELHGQECYSLTNVQPLGCVLATTTNSLVLISSFLSDGQNTIQCRTLRIPQGILAGIGRKMSSFIFGGMPNQSAENKTLIKVLAEDCNEDEEKCLYVLAGNSLQKWHLIDQEPDKLLYEYDMDRQIKEHFLDICWNRETIHIHQLRTWSIDMQFTRKGLTVLVAGMNPQVSSQLFYAFGVLNVSSIQPPSGFSSFCVIKLTERYTERDEEKLLGYRFITPSIASNLSYIYSSHKVMCYPFDTSTDEGDIIEFTNHGDRILGSGTSEGLPLFFSKCHGLVAIVSNKTPVPKFLQEAVTPKTSLIELPSKGVEPVEVEDGLPNQASYLKQSLVLYCRKEFSKSQAIVDKLFPPSVVSFQEPNSLLDVTVVAVSEELIDDYPASDPRWAESLPDATSSISTSLILLHQLEDKIRAHDCFIQFLKSVGLWEKLSAVKVRDVLMPSHLLLCEHVEKVIAALSLRSLHSRYNDLLEAVIKLVLEERDVNISGMLTYQDIFYREVSAIDDAFAFLITWEESQLDGDVSASKIFHIITSVNTIFLEVIQDVLKFRQSKANDYKGQIESKEAEYLPWTSSVGERGLYTILTKQHDISVEYGISVADDIQSIGTVFQQLLELSDIVLDGYKCRLESLKWQADQYDLVEQRYIEDRRKLIMPLLKVGQYERAAALAEKYCDFKILVELCEQTDNQDRLQRYMIQFAEQGFSDFVFKWYLEEGKRSKLLSQPPSQHNKLTKFLQDHENLSWHHFINTKQYELAHRTLKKLALNEHMYLSKKKTLFSLSKLAALTSKESPEIKDSQINAINMEQDLILYQETLPTNVLEAFDLDPDRMRVLTPKELIEMYICDENTGANEYDFKKALDLLSFLDTTSEDLESIKVHIWARAVLKDRWEDLDMNNPLESMKDLIFFRTVELAFTQGADLFELLPPIEMLLHSSEIGVLADSPAFAFLLRASYERISRLVE